MKIGQIAPLFESVPPKFYGGTERVVSYLTEELVLMGHDVTLYASGDSITTARLVSCSPVALRLDKKSVDPIADHVFLAERVFQDSGKFDIIHSHIDYIFYPLLRRIDKPNLTTLHGRLDIPNLQNIYREFSEIPVVSISDHQRLPLPGANWQATVFHGLPQGMYECNEGRGEYLAFIGRISPEKRVDRAIEIARYSGMKLKIAAKVDNVDLEYFNHSVRPFLNESFVEFLGEIGEAEKNDFLGNAHALIFPVDWPEPFGLVMIESMACGTPIIARKEGSVPEIMENGVTGFVVQDKKSALLAVKKISGLVRRRCRQVFEEKFTSRKMAEKYISLYQKLIAEKNGENPSSRTVTNEGWQGRWSLRG